MRNRKFDLVLPKIGSLLATDRPGLKEEALSKIAIRAPEELYIPKVLERDGLAGYERDTLSVYLALMSNQSERRVFDIGANIGVFSLLTSALTNWHVTAFEPVPSLVKVAKRLAKHNGLPIEIEQVAFASTSGMATLYLSSVTDSSNSLREGFRPSDKQIRVPTISLDQYCAKNRVFPDLIKIDTETTEPDVLRGGLSLLDGKNDSRRPIIICEALAGRTEHELTEIINSVGYSAYHINGYPPYPTAKAVVGDPTYKHNNWLFTPNRLEPGFWDEVRVWMEAFASCQPSRGSATRVSRIPLHGAIFSGNDKNPQLLPQWRPVKPPTRLELLPQSTGLMKIASTLGTDRRAYVAHGQTRFDELPHDWQDWRISGDQFYEMEIESEFLAGPIAVQAWIIEYDSEGRIAHHRQMLRNGPNSIIFEASSDARCIRLAFRISGSGTCLLGPVRLHMVIY